MTRLTKDMISKLREINAAKGIDMDAKSETQYGGTTIYYCGKPKYTYYVRYRINGMWRVKSFEFISEARYWIDTNKDLLVRLK